MRISRIKKPHKNPKISCLSLMKVMLLDLFYGGKSHIHLRILSFRQEVT